MLQFPTHHLLLSITSTRSLTQVSFSSIKFIPVNKTMVVANTVDSHAVVLRNDPSYDGS